MLRGVNESPRAQTRALLNWILLDSKLVKHVYLFFQRSKDRSLADELLFAEIARWDSQHDECGFSVAPTYIKHSKQAKYVCQCIRQSFGQMG